MGFKLNLPPHLQLKILSRKLFNLEKLRFTYFHRSCSTFETVFLCFINLSLKRGNTHLLYLLKRTRLAKLPSDLRLSLGSRRAFEPR